MRKERAVDVFALIDKFASHIERKNEEQEEYGEYDNRRPQIIRVEASDTDWF